MSDYTLYGTPMSTYVRTARMVLAEKGVDYDLVDVNIFQGEHQSDSYLRHHPFRKVPAFSAPDVDLFETAAIADYLELRHPEPVLLPVDPRGRGLARQWVCALDSYIYPVIIGKLVWERIVKGLLGDTPDEAVVQAALPQARYQCGLLDRALGESRWLAGDELTIADLFVAPVIAYLSATDEGKTLLADHPELARWWSTLQQRPSLVATAPQL